jgi:hypothetical protein
LFFGFCPPLQPGTTRRGWCRCCPLRHDRLCSGGRRGEAAGVYVRPAWVGRGVDGRITVRCRSDHPRSPSKEPADGVFVFMLSFGRGSSLSQTRDFHEVDGLLRVPPPPTREARTSAEDGERRIQYTLLESVASSSAARFALSWSPLLHRAVRLSLLDFRYVWLGHQFFR